MKRVLLAAALMIAVLAFTARADIPQTLNYQGVLTDAGGVAVPDGDYIIEFNIYDIASGGTALWTETDTVSVSKGIFSVVLGRWTTLNLAFDEPYWLGMAVEGETELDPRVELTATAYSLNSQGVTGTDNVFPSSGNVGIGTTSPSQPLTIVGDPSDVVGLQYNGYNTTWNMIYVNSAQPLGRSGYGYQRTGGTKAYSFVDTDDYWKLRVGTENVLFVSPGGDLGIRVLIPVEKLDVAGGIRLGSAAGTNAGTIQWTGSDFEGYDGSTWQSLTGGAGGNLPAGSFGQTLWYNGTDWAATSFLHNEGTGIGIGTTEPDAYLHIFEDVDEAVGIEIENVNSAAYSTEYISFSNEDGQLAGIMLYDDDRPIYASQMAIFNNRPSGSINLRTGGVDRVRLTESGNVGIGTTNPSADLEIIGDNILNHFKLTASTGAGPAIYFDAVDADWVIYASNPGSADGDEKLIFRDQGSAAARMAIVPGGNVGIGTTTPVKMLDVNGSIRAIDTLIAPVAELGKWGSGGELRILRSGVSGGALGMDANVMAAGMRLRLWDEAGAVTHYMDADPDGEGGHFSVMRDNLGRPGFTVDGNRNGTADTYVEIDGLSTTVFDMSESDDNSVLLPTNAVSSPEILNETGCASDIGPDNSMDPGVIEILGERTIIVPSAGYVLAIGTARIDINHTNGIESGAQFGVSDNPGTWPDNQEVILDLNDGLPTGGYSFPVTVHGLFEVGGAGELTYYFQGYEGIGSVSAAEIQFTLVFIPTAYGSVQPTAMAAASGGPLPKALGTSTGNAAERAESIAFNEARIERELAEMRAKIAELEKAVNNR